MQWSPTAPESSLVVARRPLEFQIGYHEEGFKVVAEVFTMRNYQACPVIFEDAVASSGCYERLATFLTLTPTGHFKSIADLSPGKLI